MRRPFEAVPARDGVMRPGRRSGNLVFTAASSYLVEIDPATSDRTHITGSATPGGATVSAIYAAGSYVNKKYTILSADGGVAGTFGALNAQGLTQVSGEAATGTQQTTFNAMSQFMGLLTDPFIGGRGHGAVPGPGATPFAAESANAYAANDRRRDAHAMFGQ